MDREYLGRITVAIFHWGYAEGGGGFGHCNRVFLALRPSRSVSNPARHAGRGSNLANPFCVEGVVCLFLPTETERRPTKELVI